MWFRRSIAFAAGSAILAGLVAMIAEAKRTFDEREAANAEAKAEAEEKEASGQNGEEQ